MNTTEDFMGDYDKFSPQQLRRIQALSDRMQAVNSLLGFFDSDDISDRLLANDCKLITHYLKIDFEETLIALLQLLDLED